MLKCARMQYLSAKWFSRPLKIISLRNYRNNPRYTYFSARLTSAAGLQITCCSRYTPGLCPGVLNCFARNCRSSSGRGYLGITTLYCSKQVIIWARSSFSLLHRTTRAKSEICGERRKQNIKKPTIDSREYLPFCD